MDKVVLRPHGNLCEVRLELPWEVARIIADHGPGLVKAIRQAVESHERDLAENENRRRVLEEACRRNVSAWAVLGRVAARELRKPSNRKRSEIVREIAERYGVQVNLVNNLVAQHERDRRKALRHRRDREILLLHLQGIAPAEIAAHVSTRNRPVARHTVYQVLSEHKDMRAAMERLFPHTMASVRRKKGSGHD